MINNLKLTDKIFYTYNTSNIPDTTDCAASMLDTNKKK